MAVLLGAGPETAVVQSQRAGVPTAVLGQGSNDTFVVLVLGK